MSTHTKSKAAKSKPVPPPDEACLHADEYLAAKITIKAAEKVKDDAKKYLLGWLGPETCKTLTDGRIVSRISTSFPAQMIDRRAYTSETLVVSGPPA